MYVETAVAGEIDTGTDSNARQRREGPAAVANERDGRLRVAGVRSGPLEPDHAHDPIRFGEWQGPNENGVDRAGDHGRGAKADTEDDDRRNREPGILPERAGADPEVPPQIGEELPPALLPLPTLIDADARCLDLRVVAEAPRGLCPCPGRIVAFPHEPLDELVHVKTELCIDVRADVGSPEPEIAPPHGGSRHTHLRYTPSAASSTLPIAAANAAQPSVSLRSRARPCGVNR